MQKFGELKTKEGTTVLFDLNSDDVQLYMKLSKDSFRDKVELAVRFLTFCGSSYVGSIDAGFINYTTQEISRSFTRQQFLQNWNGNDHDPICFILELSVRKKGANRCTTFSSRLFSVKSKLRIKLNTKKPVRKWKCIKPSVSTKRLNIKLCMTHNFVEMADLPQ